MVLCIGSLVATSGAYAQSIPDGKRKEIHARRVNPQAPAVDGRLDDEAWKHASFRSDFLEKEPDQGTQPTDKTEVAVLYDDHALYIGARMYCADPDRLRMHLDRRDNQGPAEQFIVTIDSYLDRRTGYGFGINTSGVRFDRYNPKDDEYTRDYSYDPIWDGHTARDSVSWTAEMRIPLSQLRFTDKAEQVWGINFNRWIPERNEDVYWVYVPREETGWSSYFGNLVGIKGIKPARRLELLPYTASDASFIDGDFTDDPFHDGREQSARVGGDLKMGLGPNLTLDATINPDFGQVEADPAEVNLSAYETFFSERRPFFTEGSQLLSGDGPSYFYSRRIGAHPHGYSDGDFVDEPSNSTILGAAKVTGRLKSGTSVGALAAATQREFAKSYELTTGETNETEIEPFTAYGVMRVSQEFGADQSTAGIILTGVERDLTADSRLDSLLRRRAITGGGDWRLRFDGGQYELYGFAGFSQISGSKASILRAQTSSARYYQRPDADYVELDPDRTSLTGYTGQLQFTKRSGTHWVGGVWGNAESPGFELNDAGRLSQADELSAGGYWGYHERTPASFYRHYYFEVHGNSSWNYGGTRQFGEAGVYGEVTFKNFWTTYLFVNHQLTGQDAFRTRGGPSMQNEAGYSIGAGFSNSYGGVTGYSGDLRAGYDELGGWIYVLSGSLSTRLGTHWKLSVAPNYRWEDQPRQYVATIDTAGGGALTYGSRYVFARIARSTLSAQFRMSYFFTPDLSLEVYAEPFAASGRYYDHGELIAAGGHDLRLYKDASGTSITQNNDNSYTVTDNGQAFTLPYLDFGARSFRSNMVLRWEFRSGSTFFLVWQRNLAEDHDVGRFVRPASLFNAFGAEGTDFFAIKLAYWIPVS